MQQRKAKDCTCSKDSVKDVTPRSLTVADLFAGNNGHSLFYIPFYQRGYEWSVRNAEDLLRGLHTASAATDAARRRDLYIMGSIIVTNEHSESWPADHMFLRLMTKAKAKAWGQTITSVVDGQQRLTTLTLLMTALRSIVLCRLDSVRLDQRPGTWHAPTAIQKQQSKVGDPIVKLYDAMNKELEEMLFVTADDRRSMPRLLPLEDTLDARNAGRIFGQPRPSPAAGGAAEQPKDPPTTPPSHDVLAKMSANYFALRETLSNLLPSYSRTEASSATEYWAIRNFLNYVRDHVVFIRVDTSPDYARQVFDVVNKPGTPLDPIARLKFDLVRAGADKPTASRIAQLYRTSTDIPVFQAVCHAWCRDIMSFDQWRRRDDDSVEQDENFSLIVSTTMESIRFPENDTAAKNAAALFRCETHDDRLSGLVALLERSKPRWDAILSLRDIGPKNELEWALWEFMSLEAGTVSDEVAAGPANDQQRRKLGMMAAWKPLVLRLLEDAELDPQLDGIANNGRPVPSRLLIDDNNDKQNVARKCVQDALVVQLGAMFGGLPEGGKDRETEVRRQFQKIIQCSVDGERYIVPAPFYDAIRKGIHGPVYNYSGHAQTAGRHLLLRVELELHRDPTDGHHHGWFQDAYGGNVGRGPSNWQVEHLTARCIEDWQSSKAINEKKIVVSQEDYDFYVRYEGLHRLGNLALLEGYINNKIKNEPLPYKFDKLVKEDGRSLQSSFRTFTDLEKGPDGKPLLRTRKLFEKRHKHFAVILYKAYGLAGSVNDDWDEVVKSQKPKAEARARQEHESQREMASAANALKVAVASLPSAAASAGVMPAISEGKDKVDDHGAESRTGVDPAGLGAADGMHARHPESGSTGGSIGIVEDGCNDLDVDGDALLAGDRADNGGTPSQTARGSAQEQAILSAEALLSRVERFLRLSLCRTTKTPQPVTLGVGSVYLALAAADDVESWPAALQSAHGAPFKKMLHAIREVTGTGEDAGGIGEESGFLHVLGAEADHAGAGAGAAGYGAGAAGTNLRTSAISAAGGAGLVSAFSVVAAGTGLLKERKDDAGFEWWWPEDHPRIARVSLEFHYQGFHRMQITVPACAQLSNELRTCFALFDRVTVVDEALLSVRNDADGVASEAADFVAPGYCGAGAGAGASVSASASDSRGGEDGEVGEQYDVYAGIWVGPDCPYAQLLFHEKHVKLTDETARMAAQLALSYVVTAAAAMSSAPARRVANDGDRAPALVSSDAGDRRPSASPACASVAGLASPARLPGAACTGATGDGSDAVSTASGTPAPGACRASVGVRSTGNSAAKQKDAPADPPRRNPFYRLLGHNYDLILTPLGSRWGSPTFSWNSAGLTLNALQGFLQGKKVSKSWDTSKRLRSPATQFWCRILVLVGEALIEKRFHYVPEAGEQASPVLPAVLQQALHDVIDGLKQGRTWGEGKRTSTALDQWLVWTLGKRGITLAQLADYVRCGDPSPGGQADVTTATANTELDASIDMAARALAIFLSRLHPAAAAARNAGNCDGAGAGSGAGGGNGWCGRPPS